MAETVVLLDTSILIEYFRSAKKDATKFAAIESGFTGFCISTITEFEIYTGVVTDEHEQYWREFLKRIPSLVVNTEVARLAAKVWNELKRENKLLPPADVLIAATALHNKLPLATHNVKHFERVRGLQLV